VHITEEVVKASAGNEGLLVHATLMSPLNKEEMRSE
jgi:hypothetical protein